ncbi:MAG: response regulator transcription factor [Alphaproteobacteria bacterium]|nr:response regulator transcription factor [Alphaproteobacteria bacterium]
MTNPIFLLIPDEDVREAVAEQIAAASLGPAQGVEDGNDLLKQCAGTDGAVIVADETAYDPKLAAALVESHADILLLGGEGAEGVAETFAKPLRLGHLLARLRYYLETAPLLRQRSVTFGPWRLEPHNRRAVNAQSGDAVRLTEKETALLVFLSQSETPPTRCDILAGVWGYGEGIDTHTLETHLYQLRRKLDAGGADWLINENGAYRLAQAEAA